MYHDWVSLKINDVLGQFFPKQKRFTTCSKYRIAVFFHREENISRHVYNSNNKGFAPTNDFQILFHSS